ncbi:VOC family protein [Amphritea sp. 1_MG-2023]|uniref:VOC family protein n=1 Tax=Amphritea sp. 1_MG-2023 TaxID=3062670 RepID=UPI0026E226A1|nr:VOC family protein [Amphritea sp. 1_MG-2023]MDO6564110.1 VOC family protein [Amphritea sp. 1_MG-2023]
MFSHVMLGANDIEKSRIFYDAILGELGYEAGVLDSKGRYFYFSDTGIFALTQPINGEPACHGNGATTGFAASTPELVDAWHAAGIAAGGETCEEPPGIRMNGSRQLYLAYLRDPSGNKICAAHFMPES